MPSTKISAEERAAIDGSALPVTFHDLEVGYDSNVVLHGISAEIANGTCVAITGSNGSGKSTLMKAILGLAPIWSGRVSLYGNDIQRTPRRDIPWARVGYVPQRNTIGGGISATVREIVASGTLGPRRWWYSRGTREKVDRALNRVGILHREAEAFRVLSGGQQQRVLIARALVRDPDLLLLDEPLTGLDTHNRQILAEVLSEHKAAGKTAMIVLHELGELAPLIDRELLISSGHLVHDGPCTHSPHPHDVTAHDHGVARHLPPPDRSPVVRVHLETEGQVRTP